MYAPYPTCPVSKYLPMAINWMPTTRFTPHQIQLELAPELWFLLAGEAAGKAPGQGYSSGLNALFSMIYVRIDLHRF